MAEAATNILDELLMEGAEIFTDEVERKVAARLKRDKVKLDKLQEELESKVLEVEESDLVKTAKSFAKVVREQSINESIKQGMAIGFMLRENISECRFDGATFYTVLCIAIMKDLIDVPDLLTLNTIGKFVNIACSVALFIIFFLRRSRIKGFIVKMLFKRLWKWVILFIVAETVPIVDLMPNYVICTILLKRKVNKKRRELENQLEDVEETVKELEKRKSYA